MSALALVASSFIAVSGGAAVAAPPTVNGRGLVHCRATGTTSYSPKLSRAAQVIRKLAVKGTLACNVGQTGNAAVRVVTAKLRAASGPFVGSCSAGSPSSLRATIKWQAAGGKVSPTTIVTGSPSRRSTQPYGYTFTAGKVTGSYAAETGGLAITSGTTAASCGVKGLKRWSFSGALTLTSAVPKLPVVKAPDFGAFATAVVDDTAAVQRTIDAAAAGGVAYLPPGQYRIEGSLQVPAGVTLAGAGWTQPATDPSTGTVVGTPAGSWLVVPASNTGRVVSVTGKGGAVRDLAIRHEQPSLTTPGWQPRDSFDWAITVNETDALVSGVFLLNPTRGIDVEAGRVTVDRVEGQPIRTGLRINHALDVVRVNNLRWSSASWSNAGVVRDYSAAFGSGIDSFVDHNPQWSGISIKGYANCIYLGSDVHAGTVYPTLALLLYDAHLQECSNAILADATNTTASIANTWIDTAIVGLNVAKGGSVFSASDVDVRNLSTNGIRVEGAGSTLLVDRVLVMNWRMSGPPFPAIEATSGATVKVGPHRGFVGSGPELGGTGSVQAFAIGHDIRIPSPSSPPGILPLVRSNGYSVRDFGARGDGLGDDSVAIQAALDAAAGAGGGIVHIPAGQYRLRGQVRVPTGVTLVGQGWEGEVVRDDSIAADGRILRPFKGSYLVVDAGFRGSALVVASSATIRDLAIRHDQPVAGPGWQPIDYGWAILVQGTNVRVDNVLLFNPTRGLRVESAGAGPVVLERIVGQPSKVGLQIDTGATVRVDGIHFWPFWTCCQPHDARQNIESYVKANATGVDAFRSTNAELSNTFALGYNIGLYFGQTDAGSSTGLELWNADFDHSRTGIHVNAAHASATIGNWQTLTQQTGLLATAPNAHIRTFNGATICDPSGGIVVTAPGTIVDVDTWKSWGCPASGAVVTPIRT